MNNHIIAGNWKQLKGNIHAKWGDLRDDGMQVAEENTDYLVGKLQERYGWDRDRDKPEVSDFKRSVTTDHLS